MAHDIETSGDLAAFVASRQPAWHTLGHVADEDLNLTDALRLGHLAGWDVHLEPAYASADGQTFTRIAGKSATVRTNPFTGELEPLATVSDDYRVWQNEEVGKFGEAIVDAGLVVDAAGSLNGGKRIFITFRTPEELLIGGTDAIQPYLVLTGSHDGISAVGAQATSIRVVCKNTLDAMLGQTTAQRYRAPHFGEGPDGRIADAREALGVVFSSAENLVAEAEKWLAVDLTPKMFDRILIAQFPIDDDSSAKAVTRATNARDAVRKLYEDAPTQANIRGTAWAALNATTEFLEWWNPADRDPLLVAQSRWIGQGPAKRAKAVATMRKLIPAVR